MNKSLMKLKTRNILIAIHRGFLDKETSDGLTDEQILANVPPSTHTWYTHPETGERWSRLSPFTEKWVRKRVKQDPDITAYDLLRQEGFEHFIE